MRRALAECKALDEKVGGAEINKFAGKLRPERSRRLGQPIAGYFISLSGFTETAVDQEREAADEAIILIDGARAALELIKGRVLVTRETAASQAGKCSVQHPELSMDPSFEIFAHKIGWLWAIFFNQGKQRTHFLLIHADGTPLSASIARIVADEAQVNYGDMATLASLNPVAADQGEEKSQFDAALSLYRDYLRVECGSIMLDGLPADADVGTLKLHLESLFVPLHVVLEPRADPVIYPSRSKRRQAAAKSAAIWYFAGNPH